MAITNRAARAVDVWFDADRLFVRFEDGRELGTPIARFPRLLHATQEQREDWRLIGRGVGIHWPQIDEDLSVAGLLEG
jgi:Protein of unknown function (DUF2442)